MNRLIIKIITQLLRLLIITHVLVVFDSRTSWQNWKVMIFKVQ